MKRSRFTVVRFFGVLEVLKAIIQAVKVGQTLAQSKLPAVPKAMMTDSRYIDCALNTTSVIAPSDCMTCIAMS